MEDNREYANYSYVVVTYKWKDFLLNAYINHYKDTQTSRAVD